MRVKQSVIASLPWATALTLRGLLGGGPIQVAAGNLADRGDGSHECKSSLKPGWSEQNLQRLLESFRYTEGFLRILKALIDLASVTGAQGREGLISVSFVGVAFVGSSINQLWIN